MSEWLAVEAIIRQKDKEKTAMAVAKLSSGSGSGADKTKHSKDHYEIEDDEDDDYLMENDVFEDNDFSDKIEGDDKDDTESPVIKKPNKSSTDSGNVPDDTGIVDTDEQEQVIETEDPVGGNNILLNSKDTSPSTPSSYQTVENDYFDYFIDGTTSCPENQKPMEGIEKFASIEDIAMKIVDDLEDDEEISLQQTASVIVTNASIDISNLDRDMSNGEETKNDMSPVQEETNTLDALQEPKSACVSPASSNGGVYSVSFCLSFSVK